MHKALTFARRSRVEPDREGRSQGDAFLAGELVAHPLAHERQRHAACNAEEYDRVLSDSLDGEVFARHG